LFCIIVKKKVMTSKTLILKAAFVLSVSHGLAQNQIVGKWKTIDDSSGEVKSVIEITERDGLYFGRITKLFLNADENQDPICNKCSSEDKRFKERILGMEILRDLKKNGDEYTDGNILDPEIGKVYRCKLWREGDILKVRGYWGPFFRTQMWIKAS